VKLVKRSKFAPANGGVIDALTGGQLTTLLRLILADTGAIQDFASAIEDLAAQLDGPRASLGRARDRIGRAWEGDSRDRALRDMMVLDGCFGDTNRGLRRLSDSVGSVGDQIQRTQDTYNRTVQIGNALASAQLSIPFVGQAVATATSLAVIAAVAKLLIGVGKMLAGAGDTMRTSDVPTAGDVITRASGIANGIGGGPFGGGPFGGGPFGGGPFGGGPFGSDPSIAPGAPPPYQPVPYQPAPYRGAQPMNGSQSLTPTVFDPRSSWVAVDPASQSSGTAHAPAAGDDIVIKATKDGVEVHMSRPNHDVSLHVDAVIDGKKVSQDVKYDGDGDGKVAV
jgi:uncharacterized protein YukE